MAPSYRSPYRWPMFKILCLKANIKLFAFGKMKRFDIEKWLKKGLLLLVSYLTVKWICLT